MAEHERNAADGLPSHETALAHVDEQIANGQSDRAHRLIHGLLQDDRIAPTPELEAELRLRIAICEYELSRIRRARDGAKEAALRFRRLGRTDGEVHALAIWSRAASRQGHHGEAVERAMLAKRLAKGLPRGPWTTAASLSLGAAFGWAHRRALALEELAAAAHIADRDDDVIARLEVCVERLWLQAANRYETAQVQGLQNGQEALAEVDALVSRVRSGGRPGTNRRASIGSLEYAAVLVSSLLASCSGLVDIAEQRLMRCTALEQSGQRTGWLMAAKSWLQAEIASARGDFDAAALHGRRLSSWAAEVEHLPLAGVAHRLTSELHIKAGRSELAVGELEALLTLERDAQARYLETRADAVEREYAAREDEVRLDALISESQILERWAFEDDLTGLPNLRRFQHALEEWERGRDQNSRPMCVALIDVDRFKLVNDTHGHEAGNKVLCGIADVIKANVRPTDLPSRWGGDEFAILLPDTELAAAEQIAERIEEAMARFDWAAIAPQLQVGVSVGAVEALPGETKSRLVHRSDSAMFARKEARRHADVERGVASGVIPRVTRWLRTASRVVLYVGAASDSAAVSDVTCTPLGALPFMWAECLRQHPQEFRAQWMQWRRDHRGRQPTEALRQLVALSHQLPQSTFITERIDGVLDMAGATNVIELYGNGFRNRCMACGRVNPNTNGDHCLPCGDPVGIMRPDVTLLGEQPDQRLFAGAGLAAKRAEVLLVVDWDGALQPSAGLLEKARTRGARVVVLGAAPRVDHNLADVWIAHDAAAVLKVLAARLGEVSQAAVADLPLTDAGFEVLCFLTGQGTDSNSHTLDQAMGWSDWELERNLRTLPWMFPLSTRSRMAPEAPMPTAEDFELLAGHAQVRAGMERAFLRMLRFYGFAESAGKVSKAEYWQVGFANWALRFSHHDLCISRLLGSLTNCGLGDRAKAFLGALEPEVLHYRGGAATEPLRFWRQALDVGSSA